MKSITMSALKGHKLNAARRNTACHLDYASNEGIIPQMYMIWRYLWGYAENEIRKKLKEKSQDSKAKKKGNETRT